ncbi:hypothetical protein V6Z11_A02G125400 [Gossypium hirsutum]
MVSVLSGNSFACLRQSFNTFWILDSSASDLIYGSKNLFSSLIPPLTSSTATLANGSKTVIKGVGEIYLLPSIPLVLVLYTPECLYNLISISKLFKQFNCKVIFYSHF